MLEELLEFLFCDEEYDILQANSRNFIMSFIASNIKSIVSIKVKQRNDSITDQVSRILVAKVFILGSLVMGLDWFHDKITCMPPKGTELRPDFIHSSCWIKGFYVFPALGKHMDRSGYYGIPLYLDQDGIRNGTHEFCASIDKDHIPVPNCIPMRKLYFSQYQWMPFYVASLAILFYMPYIIFRVVNTDMISLRYNMGDTEVKTDDIIQNYFNHDINSLSKMRVRVVANVFVKIFYVVINVSTFIAFNGMLNYQFIDYGVDWVQWARNMTFFTMDFNIRTEPTPGNKMLPSFGLCELHEARLDATHTYVNRVRMICEVSANVLYQYIFIAIWFLLVISISMSCFGVLLNIFGHLANVICLSKSETSSKYIYKFLTFRECEYMEFIRRKNLAVYGSIIRALVIRKAGHGDGVGNRNHEHNDGNNHRQNSIMEHLVQLNAINSSV